MAKKSRFDKCVDSVTRKGGAVDPRAVCATVGRRKYGQAEMTRRSVAGKKRAGKRNPAAESLEAYREFHGREADEIVTVQKKVHFHRHLAGAGQLRMLKIRSVDGRRDVKLTGFKGALLAFNEKKNQLFVEGGDQSVDLGAFGIDPQNHHELETLGKCLKIDYFTTKDHLGDEGGTAVYGHRFRTTNENGRHITVRIARYPDVIYSVPDEQLLFSGGSYEIRAEGIDK